MAGKPKPARVLQWNGDYFLFYFDHVTGKQVRRKCSQLGVFNYEQRKERAEVREANPKARMGISASTHEIIRHNVGHFETWLESEHLSKLRSKDLNPVILKRYARFVATEGTKLGETATTRSANTINQYKRNLKTCIRWISQLKPRRIVDRDDLMDALKADRTAIVQRAVAYTPKQLSRFLTVALERERKDRVAEVEREVKGKTQRFSQTAPSSAATPVSRLFLLIALTGCRRGEALGLKWRDVDFVRNRITIHAEKTGMMRWVPLTGAAEGEIAPGFARLLKAWKDEGGAREHVLPHDELDSPVFPKGAWDAIGREAGVPDLSPQRLRQNFTSYAASLGIPPAVSAMWQGHSAEVAERHYRAQVLDRVKNAGNFEEAMGLAALVADLASSTSKK
jgi:integrase